MSTIISLIAQKGGVGKSALARLLATDLITSGIQTAIADMDARQQTAYEWAQRRQTNDWKPQVPVLQVPEASQLPAIAAKYPLLIVDTPPYSSTLSLAVAQLSTLTLLPTRNRLDDLIPQVRLANDLLRQQIPAQQIAFVFNAISDSKADYQAALDYLKKTPYRVLNTFIPYRTAYGKSSDEGLAFSETTFASLQEKAVAVSQEVINLIQ